MVLLFSPAHYAPAAGAVKDVSLACWSIINQSHRAR